MNIFGIGLPEMAVIFVLALLVFGPKKLPEIGRSLGKAIKGFQEASKEFETEFKREAEQIEKTVKTTMEAKLEPPTQKVLAATEPETTTDVEKSDDSVVDAVLEEETAS
jgi:sec-independent protein translocase protein TatA